MRYRLNDGRVTRSLSRARDAGQAALGMVIGLVLLLSLSAGTLAATAIQHDPLVSNDVIQHLAYRALQSGIDSYLATSNASPNLVNCNSSNQSSCGVPTSQLAPLNSWQIVAGSSSNPVTESYMWTNPALCFNAACSSVSSTAGQALQYIKELVYGKAAIGNNVAYQSSYVNFTPENGFLTHIWWSNYESTVPAAGQTANCTWDWNNSYGGPDTTNQGNFGSANCAAVYYGPNDVLYGPIYSNDSLYVANGPNFGSSAAPSTVTTHDPNCLFVDPLDGHGSASTCSAATGDVGVYNSTTSSNNAQLEPLPATDTSLETIAAQDGCVFSGPTVITLVNSGTTEKMQVWSPDTPYTSGTSTVDNSTTGTNQDLNPTNPNSCNAGYTSSNGATTPVPANGVVYVENTPSSQTCQSFANPYDGQSPSGTYSQVGNYYGQTATPDCEGDAFVQGTVTGALTIATQNNVVIDGNITYTDCGSSFTSTFTGQCAYNSTGTPNDALGLIAFAYVEVNRPLSSSGSVEPACGSGGAPPVPYCDPSNGSGLTIDAAVLALNDGFGVNNYTSGGPEGTLTIYGSLSEDYRPAVGTFSGSSISTGYSKDYVWDSRLGYVNVPYYLDPGTPLWAISSTAVNQAVSCTTSTALPGVWNPAYNYGSYPNSPGNCVNP